MPGTGKEVVAIVAIVVTTVMVFPWLVFLVARSAYEAHRVLCTGIC